MTATDQMKAEIFCEPNDQPSCTHGGWGRIVWYRLKLAGVEIEKRIERYPWEVSFDITKHEWPRDLVSMRDAINVALAAMPSTQPAAQPWALAISRERLREKIMNAPDLPCDAGAFPQPAAQPVAVPDLNDAFNALGAALETLPASTEQTQLSIILQSFKRRALRYQNGEPPMKLHFDDAWLRERILADLGASPAAQPVAVPHVYGWFVKDFADGWIFFDNKDDADRQVNGTGAMMLAGVANPPADAQAAPDDLDNRPRYSMRRMRDEIRKAEKRGADAQAARIAGLETLVEEAYWEGFNEGNHGGWVCGPKFEDSDASKALKGRTDV